MEENGVKLIRVLMLEDDPNDANLVREILSEENSAAKSEPFFKLEVVTRLEDGIECLQKKDHGFDVIIADLNLPDSSGFETFDKLHLLSAELSIVILTGLDNKDLAFEAVKRGAQDFLPKSKLNANNLPRILRYAVERKRIERQIYAAEEKYRTIFENSAVAIMLADANECVVSWNKFTEDLLGMGHEDLHLKHVSSLYPQKEFEKIRACNIRKKGMQHRLETKMFRKDGSVIDVDISIAILRDISGVITGSIGIVKDITEQKKLENLKDEFINTVSHELRTPLAIIREAVSQVLEGILGKTTAEQRKFLTISLENIDRLTRIVNDLLDISKLETGNVQLEKELIDIAKIVQKVCDGFEARTKTKSVKINLRLSRPSIELYADEDKIVQVFTNLIGNALKFTDQGQVDIFLEDHPGAVECVVADTGRGIPEEDLSKVFSKFQQFGRVIGPGEKGTGLGLAISKGIVELHHGKIWVRSKVNEGSRFTFFLPKFSAKELFGEKISETVANATREGFVFSVIIFDLSYDRELYGEKIKQKMGEEILPYLKEWMRQDLPKKVEVAVKDMSAILLTVLMVQKEEALMMAGRIQQVLKEALAKEDLDQKIQLNCRVASFPADGETVGQFIEKVRIS